MRVIGVQQVVPLFIYDFFELPFGNLYNRKLILNITTEAYGVVFDADKLCALVSSRKELYVNDFSFGFSEGGD